MKTFSQLNFDHASTQTPTPTHHTAIIRTAAAAHLPYAAIHDRSAHNIHVRNQKVPKVFLLIKFISD